MRPRILCLVLALLVHAYLAEILAAQQPRRFNADESKAGGYTLPEALVCEDGSRVRDVETWKTKRRAEILRSFEQLMYGVTPSPPRGTSERRVDRFSRKPEEFGVAPAG